MNQIYSMIYAKIYHRFNVEDRLIRIVPTIYVRFNIRFTQGYKSHEQIFAPCVTAWRLSLCDATFLATKSYA